MLPAGHRPLRVLHVSDLHLTPTQGDKRRWLASLADLEPDLVVNTGDNLAHPDSVRRWSRRSAGCSTCPASSSSGPTTTSRRALRNPLWYLFPDNGSRNTAHPQAAVARPARRASTRAAGPT